MYEEEAEFEESEDEEENGAELQASESEASSSADPAEDDACPRLKQWGRDFGFSQTERPQYQLIACWFKVLVFGYASPDNLLLNF